MMKMYETKNVDFKHEDEKGRLVQLVHEGITQVNVLESKKGCIRGNHFHKVSREAFYVAKGSVNVTLEKGNIVETTLFKEGDFFLIPTYTHHLMEFPEDCIMVAMYDIPVENSNGEKDIYRKGK